ncbi:MAG: hypothetical protein Fur0019_10940 [Tibeticola sp.]
MPARIGSEILSRVSATIRNTDRALKTINFDRADGPCLKKGGGVRSRVPSGMVCHRPGVRSTALRCAHRVAAHRSRLIRW